MKDLGLSKGLLDSVSTLLKQKNTPEVNLQEKIRRTNLEGKKQESQFASAYAAVVAEGRKKAAEEKEKYAERSMKAHGRMGKSIVEQTAPKTPREKELAAKKDPKDKITHADVLAARGVKLEEIGITDDMLKQLATSMVIFSTTKRQAVPLDEQKSVVTAMARSLLLSIDEMVEKHVAEDVRKQVAFIKAITEAKLNIQTQLINSINIGNAVSRVNESKKLKKFLDDAFEKETIKTRQAKIQADVSDDVQHEGDVVSEVSNQTKQNYIDAAAVDTARLGNTLGRLQVAKASQSTQMKLGDKITKRIKGISRASQTMKTEEAEQRDTPGNSYQHQCALHVKHSKLGEGKTLFSQHASPSEDGTIEWYDIMFEHGIEKRVPTADLEILVSESHMNHKKKKM